MKISNEIKNSKKKLIFKDLILRHISIKDLINYKQF